MAAAVLCLTRRVEFPGKRRLRRLVRLPDAGVHEVELGGSRLRLDLSESLHRDYYFGLRDQVELGLIRRLLARGGDFVDVGAHVGLYTVCAARLLRGRGRVLAIEPNPVACARLQENVAINDCANVVVDAAAATSADGHALLHVPTNGDAAWSSLVDGRVPASETVWVETKTLDAELERHALRPSVVKIDVEGCESDVLRGAPSLLERRPALLIELVETNARRVVSALGRLGYCVARAGTRHLERWPSNPGSSNAVFLQPWQLALLRPRERRAFARREEHVVGQARPAGRKLVDEARDGPWGPDERRDRAEPFSGDRDDLEARVLDELAEEPWSERPHVTEVDAVMESMLEGIRIPAEQ